MLNGHGTVILSLQQPSGTFAGDRFGETDTRFLYCAVSALSLMKQLDKLEVDGRKERAIAHICECRNFDGGFGTNPGAESHSGQGILSVTIVRNSCKNA